MVQSFTLPQHDQDDGFHEIQLNGKQLVFLFMAATVVSVVIFLCGVLVGRGVRAERAASAIVDNTNSAPATVPDPAPPQPKVPPVTGSEGASLPPATGEDLSYFNRLGHGTQSTEQLKGEAAKPAVAGLVPRPPAPADPPAAASLPPTSKPASNTAKSAASLSAAAVAEQPAGDAAFTLQVTALKERSEADAVAKRLTAKGYSAYVMTTDGSVYRVRVGRFKTRQDAEAVATRLQKEEQFKPWITR